MDIDAYEFRDRIERVEAATAGDDDLVTVAVPPDEPLGEALERVEEDRAEAEVVRTLQQRADEEGGDCIVVPTDFERGERFREAFGGVAALLRFGIE